MADDLSSFEYYKYNPSKAAAVSLVIGFAASSTLHCWQLFRTGTWYFIPFVIGGIFEAIGYAGRAASATQTPDWTLVPYIIQSIFILVAPAMFAASIYMILGRIILVTDAESHSMIRAKWMTKIFVICDVLSFLMQASGGGLMATDGNQDLGQKVIVCGLFVQLIAFGFFVVVALVFHLRLLHVPTVQSSTSRMPWQKHLLTLYVTSLLILVRSIFRVVEYLQGWDGYLLKRELYLYVFDALLMFIVMIIFNWVHPSEIKSYLRGGPMVKGWKMEPLVH
ncbi:RTA1 protein [Zopfia rhizophila CBS 207.26]|uniref:RTA1 protein n=1 Tax=Zopfia rhizophila CBS 207.26 TaxID=1314779 RepID=A0A6A6DKA9_9PEZI|nr:RTA1 protein [Zopfia rhizophila CBS 207.26]